MEDLMQEVASRILEGIGLEVSPVAEDDGSITYTFVQYPSTIRMTSEGECIILNCTLDEWQTRVVFTNPPASMVAAAIIDVLL